MAGPSSQPTKRVRFSEASSARPELPTDLKDLAVSSYYYHFLFYFTFIANALGLSTVSS